MRSLEELRHVTWPEPESWLRRLLRWLGIVRAPLKTRSLDECFQSAARQIDNEICLSLLRDYEFAKQHPHAVFDTIETEDGGEQRVIRKISDDAGDQGK